MESLATAVNGVSQLTVLARLSILDDYEDPGYASDNHCKIDCDCSEAFFGGVL